MDNQGAHPNQGALVAIPNIEQQILDAMAAGKSLAQIAREYNVSDVAILQRVRNHPHYRATIEVGLELRMDRREDQLEAATDSVSVTRADRLLGHARWLAERCAPARFGQATKITGADGGPLQVEIVRYSAPVTLDAELAPAPLLGKVSDH